METTTDIFEVLTTIATLVVVVFAGIILAYFIVVLRLVYELLERIHGILDSVKDGAKGAIESAKEHRTELLGVVGLVSGFLLRALRKRKKRSGVSS